MARGLWIETMQILHRASWNGIGPAPGPLMVVIMILEAWVASRKGETKSISLMAKTLAAVADAATV